MTTVGLFGTFAVANYGDLLFPLINQRELSIRRDDLEFIWFDPIGGHSDGWPTVIGLGPFESDPSSLELCDVAVVGGGELVVADPESVAPSYGLTPRDGAAWRPSAWFSAPNMMAKRGIPVIWNAIGVAGPIGPVPLDHLSYVSVRDAHSKGYLGETCNDRVQVVPDLAFLIEDLFPRSLLDQIHRGLVDKELLPSNPYVVLQASKGLRPKLDWDELRRVVGGRHVVAVVIGACHGDMLMFESVDREFGSKAHRLRHPAKMEEVAAVIAHADGFIGNSLHGGVTSLVYGTPFGLFDLDDSTKREGVLEIADVSSHHLIKQPSVIPSSLLASEPLWNRESVRQRLAGHFDAIVRVIPAGSSSRDLTWMDHPAVLHLGLERAPSAVDFKTDLTIEPKQPPLPPQEVGKAIAKVRNIQSLRDRITDPGRLIANALDVEPPAYMVEWEALTSEIERRVQTYGEATQGWADAANEAFRLSNSLAEAERGWRESVEVLRGAEQTLSYLETTREALESQLVGSPDSWLTQVSGPPVIELGADVPFKDEFHKWLRGDGRSPAIATAEASVKFSLLTPVYNPSAENLTDCIRSVRAQTYSDWELILVDASDTSHVAPICNRFAEIDPRVRVIRTANLGISANTNLGAEEARGDWYVLIDHDDELASHALSSLAVTISEHPDGSFIYSDEDKIDEQGRRFDPFFKPDWSPDLLRHVNYITHLQAIRRDLWQEIGGLRSDYDGAQDYDLALRASWQAGGALHIPDVLYHWRVHSESTAMDVRVKPEAHRAGRRALDDFVLRHLPGSWVEFGTGPTSHRLRYPLAPQLLSVIIPFRDQWKLTEACLEGIDRYGSQLPLEVLLVDNQSTEKATARKLPEWAERFPWARSLSYEAPFNFQKLNNWAVEQTRGDLLLFLNNDVQPIHGGWIEALAEHAQRSKVGAVGARLFYPDGLIQHAGVAVGIGGYADHPWAGLDPRSWTPAGPSFWTRNFLAVTAACLMVERSKFEAVGGFDERFTVGGGDVALGIALRDAGYWNVYTPFARLIHHESITRGNSVPESDLAISRQVYAPFLESGDPFYNPNLSLADTLCRVRTTTHQRTSAPVA